MNVREWQFDGLVGPTHNYAGLAHGNLAAQSNAGSRSNPRAAALQGLEKMRFVRDLGVPQAFLPPHFRPLIPVLKRLGFKGEASAVLAHAQNEMPGIVASVFSSSFMWTANAATVTPSGDSQDGKLHLTPANMASHFHRAIESEFTYRLLQSIFHNHGLFSVHAPLPTHAIFGDEGAANHMLLAPRHGSKGLHCFVYGENSSQEALSKKFPARQKKQASEAIARLHGIAPEQSVFIEQSPEAISAGVFHNDVIAMSTTRHIIAHEAAFTNEGRKILLQKTIQDNELNYREITNTELSLQDAVATYFFNSQFLDLGNGRFTILAPQESQQHTAASQLFTKLQDEGIVSDVVYRDLRESMRNGGGPACLRLRVAMTEREEAAVHPGIILTDARYDALKQWVNTYYRDRFESSDFTDPQLLEELAEAYTALETICELPGLYSTYIEHCL